MDLIDKCRFAAIERAALKERRKRWDSDAPKDYSDTMGIDAGIAFSQD